MAKVEIVSIKNESGRLTATLSRRLIFIGLMRVALFCVLCLSVLVFALFSSGGISLSGMVRAQPLFLVLVIPAGVLLIFTIQMVFTFCSGKAFSFDRHSDSIRYNSRKVATLSSLKEVQVRRPTFSSWKERRTSLEASSGATASVPDKLRSMPEHLRLWDWPSIWLVLNNQKPIQVLDTTNLMPIPVWPFKINFASQQQVETDVVTIATEIADYAGVVLYDETAVIQ